MYLSDIYTISVNLAVNTEGSIFCGAVPEDTVVTSVLQIKNQEF